MSSPRTHPPARRTARVTGGLGLGDPPNSARLARPAVLPLEGGDLRDPDVAGDGLESLR